MALAVFVPEAEVLVFGGKVLLAIHQVGHLSPLRFVAKDPFVVGKNPVCSVRILSEVVHLATLHGDKLEPVAGRIVERKTQVGRDTYQIIVHGLHVARSAVCGGEAEQAWLDGSVRVA